MRVVLVDDDDSILELMVAHLKARHDLEAFTSPYEAMEHAAWERTDVLVTDVMMPGMDGGALMRWVADRHPHVRRILCTAKDESQLPAEGFDLAHDLITKPFSLDILGDSIG